MFGEVALTRRSKPILSERKALIAQRSAHRSTHLSRASIPTSLLTIDTSIDCVLAVKFRSNRMILPQKHHIRACYGHCKVAACVPVAALVIRLFAMALQFTRPPPWAEGSLRVVQGSPLPNLSDTVGRMLPICYLPSLAALRLGLRLNCFLPTLFSESPVHVQVSILLHQVLA